MRLRATSVLRDEDGATAIEYGLIAALVVVAMIVALGNVATVTTGMWNRVSNQVDEHAGAN